MVENMMRDFKQTIEIGVAAGALITLGIAFFSLPPGWNLIPVFPIAIAAAFMLSKLKPARYKTDNKQTADRDITAPSVNAGESASQPGKAREFGRRMNRAFGPIAAGMIIDLVDLATFGQIGLFMGLPVGGLAGYWMGTALGLGRKAALWCALAAGIYCMLPLTEVLPLATLVGAWVRFRDSGKKRGVEGENDADCAPPPLPGHENEDLDFHKKTI